MTTPGSKFGPPRSFHFRLFRLAFGEPWTSFDDFHQIDLRTRSLLDVQSVPLSRAFARSTGRDKGNAIGFSKLVSRPILSRERVC
jgi:hypothetical protein